MMVKIVNCMWLVVVCLIRAGLFAARPVRHILHLTATAGPGPCGSAAEVRPCCFRSASGCVFSWFSVGFRCFPLFSEIFISSFGAGGGGACGACGENASWGSVLEGLLKVFC